MPRRRSMTLDYDLVGHLPTGGAKKPTSHPNDVSFEAIRSGQNEKYPPWRDFLKDDDVRSRADKERERHEEAEAERRRRLRVQREQEEHERRAREREARARNDRAKRHREEPKRERQRRDRYYDSSRHPAMREDASREHQSRYSNEQAHMNNRRRSSWAHGRDANPPDECRTTTT